MLSVMVKNQSIRIHNTLDGHMVTSSLHTFVDAHPTAYSGIKESAKTAAHILQKE